MAIVVPITVMVIFLILYTMFRSFKWAVLILVSVIMASIGGPFALFITHTNFSVSSAVGFLALFGVSVQDRRHHAGVHQSVAPAARGEPHEHIIEPPSKAPCCACVPS